jgi:solute carrier family 13 (sodium-dependent dicarboxylate transporter), member 2/3/5
MDYDITQASAPGKLFIVLIAAIAAFTLYFFIHQIAGEYQARAASILILAAILWSFEAIPLYATSLLAIVLLSFSMAGLPAFADAGLKAYTVFYAEFANPVIILFLGGFVFAAAISKHDVDRYILNRIVNFVGTDSHKLFFAYLFTAALLSMWVSNTAAAAMMISLVRPLLKVLPGSDPWRKVFPLSVAFGCNAGGMGTPIGTPPNAIVIGILRELGTPVSFAGWMLMAVPLVIVILAIAAAVLLLVYRPERKQLQGVLKEAAPLTQQGKASLSIGLAMIALWLTAPLHGIHESLTALMGITAFAAFNVLNSDDIKSLDWHVLILMWGGLALGSATEYSGLVGSLQEIPFLLLHSFFIIAIFCLIALLLSSIISNTATANIILPFAVGIAAIDRSQIAIAVALSCSLAMLLPVSTPPNAIVYSTGMITTRDMAKTGAVIALTGLIVILTGFNLMIPLAY